VRSRIKLDTGDAVGALPDAEQALSMLRAPRAGQRLLAINSRNVLANVHARLGDYPNAIAAYEAAIGELADMGRARTSLAGAMHNNFGVILINSGQLARASEVLLKSRSLSADVLGPGGVNPFSDTNLAGVWLELGRIDEAIELLEGALAFAKRQGNQRFIAFISSKAAIAWCVAGNIARCEERLQQGYEALTKILPPGHSTFGTLGLTAARLALLKGDQETARQQLQKAVSIYDAATERNPMRIVALSTLAGLEQRVGNASRASEMSLSAVASARKYVAGLSASDWLGSALLARAKLLDAQKDPNGAREAALEAKAQLETSLGPQAPATREVLALLARL
jgi:tetratricopeptide (TPR) repeat protein